MEEKEGASDPVEEDDDEDYDPTEDVDEDDDEDDVHGMSTSCSTIPSCTLSEAKRKVVDEAFEQMFGYKFGTRFLPKRRRTDAPQSQTDIVLSRIFGPTVAAQILATCSSVTDMQVQRAPLPTKTVTMVAEVKRYAGQTISVKRKVSSSDTRTAGSVSVPNGQSKPQGLDSLLQELEGPGKISTVEKTSADWESFKQDAGVEGEIEKQAQGKNAYLVKQDFLERVDQRSFVQEKAKRDLERSKRGK